MKFKKWYSSNDYFYKCGIYWVITWKYLFSGEDEPLVWGEWRFGRVSVLGGFWCEEELIFGLPVGAPSNPSRENPANSHLRLEQMLKVDLYEEFKLFKIFEDIKEVSWIFEIVLFEIVHLRYLIDGGDAC